LTNQEVNAKLLKTLSNIPPLLSAIVKAFPIMSFWQEVHSWPLVNQHCEIKYGAAAQREVYLPTKRSATRRHSITNAYKIKFELFYNQESEENSK
jgi:hypothetical protein